MRIVKIKSQLMIAFFAAVSHLNGPLRKQNFTLKGVDLKWGFHRILLAKESRYVTTFVTLRGLYRYTRLMFGVTSAPENYQQIIRDALKVVKGSSI